MGNEAPAEVQDNTVGTVEESRIYGYDSGSGAFIPLSINSDGDLEIAVESLPEPIDVSGATVTVTDDGSFVLDAASQGTLPTEQQTPVGVEDTGGSQVNPATNDDQPNWYDEDIINYDLVGSGDFTISEPNVRGTGDIIIKVDSADDNTFTVTLEWTDGNGTVLYSQSPAEGTNVTNANLKFNTASDHFQLTITDTSAAGQNTINGTVNVH